MKVFILPADMGGCGHYRLINAAEYLRSKGHDITIQYPNNEANTGFEVHFQDDVMIDFKLPVDDVDVVVMQRVSHEWHLQVIPLMRQKGIATVIDMDDDLSCIHPSNKAYWNYHPRNTNTPFSFKTAAEVCRASTYVTVSTQLLMKVYAGHGRGQVLDNYVPSRYLSIIKEPRQEPIFGWAGTVQSHPTDLLVCGKSVPTLIGKGHKFMVIGPPDGVAKQFRLTEKPQATGIVSMAGWASAMSNIDVGMAPLEASTFNRSKSRLKPLEYNSLGIPYVASPREEYRRYHRESGGGVLVDTGKEWVSAIDELMRDDVKRKELGEQGKAYAATQTIEKHAWRWWEAWTNAYEIQQAGR